jgi:hypothetical protein
MKLSEKIKKYKDARAICKIAKEKEYNETVPPDLTLKIFYI